MDELELFLIFPPTMKGQLLLVYFWPLLAVKDSLHELLGMVVYVLRFNEPLNNQEIPGHSIAIALGKNADSLLCLISILALQFVVVAIATVDQVLRSIRMLIYVDQISITLEG